MLSLLPLMQEYISAAEGMYGLPEAVLYESPVSEIIQPLSINVTSPRNKGLFWGKTAQAVRMDSLCTARERNYQGI
jgi:hypothetical protein